MSRFPWPEATTSPYIASVASRRIPEGRLGRFARLAAAGARSGAGLLLSKDGSRAAQSTAEVLGTLRGLAAKVGQMASYVDGVVPEGQRDAYELAMKGLRAAAPTSAAPEVRARVEHELGSPIDQLFAEWADEPFASASIGQVHRARLLDGREVAVKVQHPGITKALEADLQNAGIVEQMAGMLGARRFNSKAMLEVVRTRFREELDYDLEARNIETFRVVHAGDPHIRLPEVVPDRSAKRVLTTRLVQGKSFDEACAASVAEREAWARTMWRFVFKGNLKAGLFNADPHPGNYFFHDEGKVTFLDFGCVQPISPVHRKHASAMHRGAIEKNEAKFRAATRLMLGTFPGPYEDALYAFIRACFEPLWAQPFHMTRTYAASLVEQAKDMGQIARSLKDHEVVPVSEDFLFINRRQFGFYSVLARLDVTLDYAEVERDFWDELG